MSEDLQSPGSSMSEQQSYEAIVDGLKQSADGALHICSILADLRWQRVAIALASCHQAIVQRAQMRDIGDQINLDVPTISHMTVTGAFVRHIDGLRMAAGGLRQMAVYHRKQEYWIKWTHSLENMHRSAATLLKRQAVNFLTMPEMMQ